MPHTCEFCGVTFVGRGADRRWSEHAWVHWDELVRTFGDISQAGVRDD